MKALYNQNIEIFKFSLNALVSDGAKCKEKWYTSLLNLYTF
ncbi:hypothetical protein HMPREF0602_1283 [Neisseria meningitidis ATCC 13091]|uniref:Uncharacterized protein n=1 Tax=Neisseria meningitidis serogroup B (strain ATCC 13091 / M2091) TaxID=862513 RepID=E0N9V3_NEIM3|nr:hypothetical protein HMPREF0602_1283 [Neisseria meningitidis ATCC 13091]